MNANRELAIAVMNETTKESLARGDFVKKAGIKMPGVKIPGSLPATLRTEAPAKDIKQLTDLVLNWTIGDFPAEKTWSAYFDPNSPWYGVFFGSYALRSYKRNGDAWGYRRNQPDFDEFLQIPAIDYNFFLVGGFGCPPEKMSFDVTKLQRGKEQGWDRARVDATVPSGLHKPDIAGDKGLYAVYGVPDKDLLGSVPESFEPIEMHGEMYMRRIKLSRAGRKQVPEPVTLAFGALCRDDARGRTLLNQIINSLKQAYLRLY